MICSAPTETGIPVILFDYNPSRSGKTAARLLKGFAGYLQSDALGSYDVAVGPEVTQLGCWSHSRRKFDAAIKSADKTQPPPLAVQAMGFIRRLYHIDAEVEKRPPDERHAHRQQHCNSEEGAHATVKLFVQSAR